MNSIEIPGSDVVVRVGRYGPYLESGDHRVSVPDDLAPDELTAERAEELLAAPSGDSDARRASRDRAASSSPRTAATARTSPRCSRKGRTTSRGRRRSSRRCRSDTITLDQAVELLTLPRTLETRRRGDRRRERALRPLRQAGIRDPLAGVRGAAADAHDERGGGDPRAAEGPSRPRRAQAAAQRARPRSGDRQAAHREGRPLRALRHRRRDERQPPQRGRPRGADAGACARAARRTARQGPLDSPASRRPVTP